MPSPGVTIGVALDNGRAVAVLLRGREVTARRAVVGNSSAGALAKILQGTPADAKIVVGVVPPEIPADFLTSDDGPWGELGVAKVQELWDVLRGRDAVVTTLINAGWGFVGPAVLVHLGEEHVDVALSTELGVVAMDRLDVPGLGWVEVELGSGSDVGRARLARAVEGDGDDYTAGLALADWLETVLNQVQARVAQWRNQGLRVPDGVVLAGRAATASTLTDLFETVSISRALPPPRVASALLNVAEKEKLSSLAATLLALNPPPAQQCFPDPAVKGRKSFKAFPKKIVAAVVAATCVAGLGLGIWVSNHLAATGPVLDVDVAAVTSLAEELAPEFWELNPKQVTFTFRVDSLSEVPQKVKEVQRAGLAVTDWESLTYQDGHRVAVSVPATFFAQTT